MNFLFDRGQPVHLTFDAICDSFPANKTTVGSKATEIERALRLHQHSEPGLCRREIIESLTVICSGLPAFQGLKPRQNRATFLP